MNRVIKFRGKRIDNGEWITGYLYQSAKESWITDSININLESHRNIAWFRVHPESVGQFTGFIGKGGKEIYEGDIVKYHTEVRETHVAATIKFEQQAGAYWAKWSEVSEGGRTLNRYKEVTATFGDGETFQCDIYEVIGNTTDNPELL